MGLHAAAKLAKVRQAWEERWDRWQKHKKNVEWKPIGRAPLNIQNYKYNIALHKGAIATFFLTGARASEILGLVENIRNMITKLVEKRERVSPMKLTSLRFDLDPELIFVQGMQVLRDTRRQITRW